MRIRNSYTIQQVRGGKVIKTLNGHNTVATSGFNYLLNAGFAAGAQTTAWYIGLVDNSTWTAFSVSDTMASHSGWTEISLYNEATRPEWSPEASVASVCVNSVVREFTINTACTVKGLFISSSSVKGGSTGTLWATANFSAPLASISGDTLRITYSATLTEV